MTRNAATAVVAPVALLVLVFAAPGVSAQTVDPRERSANARQPHAKVMDAVGVRPGMVIGEVGAGRGRYTVFLAKRVGASGKVYANDIDAPALAYLRERCRRDGIANSGRKGAYSARSDVNGSSLDARRAGQ